MPSIICYVRPSVEILGPTIPQFLNPDPQLPDFKTDWRHWTQMFLMQDQLAVFTHAKEEKDTKI